MKFDAIFLDRDGTISHDPYGYINNVKDYDFFDFTFEALDLLHQFSDNFFIVTNQSGLSTGKIDINNLEDIHNYICLLYTSPSPRDLSTSRMPSSA